MAPRRENVQKLSLPDRVPELDSLRPVPPPDPAAWQAGRAAFMDQVRALAPQTLPDATVSAQSTPRRREWNVIALFRRLPFLAMLEVIFAFGMLTGGAVGAAYISQESLPGAPLYPLKLQLEDWQYAWLDDPVDRASFAMDKAQVRVDELIILTVRGEAIPQQVVTRYEAQLDLALAGMRSLAESQRETVREDIARQLSLEELAMARMQALLAPGTNDSVEAMLDVIGRAQAEIGAPEGAPAYTDSDRPEPVWTPPSYLTATPTPTLAATPTLRPTATPTPRLTATPTSRLTASPAARVTATSTPRPIVTRTPPPLTATPTETATSAPPPTEPPLPTQPPLPPTVIVLTPTATPLPTVTFTPSISPTPTPTATPTPTPTSLPIRTFTPTPSATATATPTPIELFTQTVTPTPLPTETPTPVYTDTPTPPPTP